MIRFGKWLFRRFGENMQYYDLEIAYCVTGLLLGLWIFFGHAISSISPSVRGLRLLGYAAHWLPWSVDITWGGLMTVPSSLQLWHRRRGHVRRRIKFAMMQATTFGFIALLLILDYPPSTGIVMYTMPAVAQLVVIRRLIWVSNGLPLVPPNPTPYPPGYAKPAGLP